MIKHESSTHPLKLGRGVNCPLFTTKHPRGCFFVGVGREDKFLIIVNKPANLLTISTEKEKDRTLYNYVYEYLKKKEVQDYLQERREEIRKESDSLLQTGFFKCFEELHNIIEKQYNSDCDRIKAIDCYLRHYEQAIYKQNEISQ